LLIEGPSPFEGFSHSYSKNETVPLHETQLKGESQLSRVFHPLELPLQLKQQY
jgi:hypothetical protein